MLIENLNGNSAVVSDWYGEGDTLILRAADEICDRDGLSCLTFDGWEVVDGPMPSLKDACEPSTAILVDGPYMFRAAYQQSFLVEARNFQGVLLQAWVPEGNEVELKTPSILEIVPERERYVFRAWQGSGITDEIDTLRLLVDRPLLLEAAYDRQFMVHVASPYGESGEGWYV